MRIVHVRRERLGLDLNPIPERQLKVKIAIISYGSKKARFELSRRCGPIDRRGRSGHIWECSALADFRPAFHQFFVGMQHPT